MEWIPDHAPPAKRHRGARVGAWVGTGPTTTGPARRIPHDRIRRAERQGSRASPVRIARRILDECPDRPADHSRDWHAPGASRKTKAPHRGASHEQLGSLWDAPRIKLGGDGGIRTLDAGFGPHAPLAGECLRPLGHVCGLRLLASSMPARGGFYIKRDALTPADPDRRPCAVRGRPIPCICPRSPPRS